MKNKKYTFKVDITLNAGNEIILSGKSELLMDIKDILEKKLFKWSETWEYKIEVK